MSAAAAMLARKGVPIVLGGASLRTFRVLWMLEELGIPYHHVPSMPQSAEVKKYNPLGKVPVLIEDDGDFVLYESAAIVTYLGDTRRDCSDPGTPPLVPAAGTRERGKYEQTMSVLLTELDAQGLWIHRKHEAMGDFFTHIPDAVAHARKYFHKTNRSLMQQLKDEGPFLLGPHFSAADIVYVHCLEWSKTIGWNDKWNSEPVVSDYLERCRIRPAYIRTRKIRTDEQRSSL